MPSARQLVAAVGLVVVTVLWWNAGAGAQDADCVGPDGLPAPCPSTTAVTSSTTTPETDDIPVINSVVPPSVAPGATPEQSSNGGGGGPNVLALVGLVLINLLAFGTAALRLLARRAEAPSEEPAG